MAELGSIFEAPGDGPVGRDLRVTVRVPRQRTGDEVRVRVPLDVAAEGGYVRRADPHGDGETLTLRLPDEVPEGAMLRLRGLGGVAAEPGRPAGDLYVTIELVDDGGDLVRRPAEERLRVLPWAGAGVVALVLAAVLRACIG